MIHLTLPYPPSANVYWRAWKGRMLVSREARAYKAGVLARCKLMRLGKPLTGAVALFVRVYRPRRVGDLGNRLKVLEDALQGIAFEDDDQVIEVHMWREDDKENPRVEVTVEPR